MILLDAGTIFEGGGKGDLVGVAEIDAEGQTAGEASNFDVMIILVEHFLEEECSRLALDAGVSSDDNFLDVVGFNAGKEFFDVKLVGCDAVDGADGAAQDMISTVVAFGLFDGVNVEWFFDDEDGRFIALRVAVKLRNFVVDIDEGKGNRATLDAVV